MTSDELRAWIESNGLSHRQAAELLAITVNQLRKMLYGVRLVDKRTIRMIQLMDMPVRVIDEIPAKGYRVQRLPPGRILVGGKVIL